MNKKKPGEITNPKMIAKVIDQGKLDQLYPLQWFRNRTKSKKGPHVSSKHLADLIWKKFKPTSVLDFGAGSLSFANRMGEKTISVAIEGSEFNKEFATHCIFVNHNLCKPLYLRRNTDAEIYDMVTSWDVIEHIPEKYEKVIVKTVVRHASNLVLLSIDSSKWGRYHVNCKPKGYWRKTFEAAGLRYEKELTKEVAEAIQNNEKITSKWYANNLLIFRVPV